VIVQILHSGGLDQRPQIVRMSTVQCVVPLRGPPINYVTVLFAAAAPALATAARYVQDLCCFVVYEFVTRTPLMDSPGRLLELRLVAELGGPVSVAGRMPWDCTLDSR
jgi:hypothetical protein